MDKKIYGMIPARSGSKGVINKNRKELCGKPLIQYTIESALQSNIDNLFVNSDCDDILTLSLDMKVNVYKRDYDLSSDLSSMKSVLIDFCKFIKSFESTEDFAVIVLYPTYPLRSNEDINAIIKKYKEYNKNLIGLKKPKINPYLLLTKDYKDFINPDVNKYYRRQDYPIYWEITHFACVINSKDVNKINNQLYNLEDQKFIHLDFESENLHNIDTIKDFEYAEYLIKRNESKRNKSIVSTV